jgi:Tfp pilus assembly protein FimT
MAELLTVMAVMAIMVAISVPYIIRYRSPYRTDDQAVNMMDAMREAAQLALTRRRTVRFELDITDNSFKVIDEQGTNPDTLVKSIPLEKAADVRVDVLPAGVTKPIPPNFTDIAFTTDSVGHMAGSTSVSGHSVWVARFQRDGSVVNNAGTPVNVNIYLFPPLTPGSTTPKSLKLVRAITLFGGSGAIRFWKHNGTALVAT